MRGAYSIMKNATPESDTPSIFLDDELFSINILYVSVGVGVGVSVGVGVGVSVGVGVGVSVGVGVGVSVGVGVGHVAQTSNLVATVLDPFNPPTGKY